MPPWKYYSKHQSLTSFQWMPFCCLEAQPTCLHACPLKYGSNYVCTVFSESGTEYCPQLHNGTFTMTRISLRAASELGSEVFHYEP